jgi:hypothetical protein
VRRCPLPACAGGPATIVANRNVSGPITNDATAIYWIEQGQVMKIAK